MESKRRAVQIFALLRTWCARSARIVGMPLKDILSSENGFSRDRKNRRNKGTPQLRYCLFIKTGLPSFLSNKFRTQGTLCGASRRTVAWGDAISGWKCELDRAGSIMSGSRSC